MTAPQRGHAAETRQGPVAARWLIWLAVGSHALLPWVTGHLPYQDITNHVARYTLIDRAWSGHPADWIRVHLVPAPYVAIDLLGVGLVHLFGPHIALRVIATIALCILPFGMYRLLRAVAPEEVEWTAVAVMLSTSPFFLKGLLNYQIGIGGMLLWVAGWWPRRSGITAAHRLGLVVGLAVLLVTHLYAAFVVLLLLAVDLGVHVLLPLRSISPRVLVRDAAGRLATGLACGATALLLLWFMTRIGPSPAAGATTVAMRSWPEKLLEFTEPFYTFSPWELLVTALPMLIVGIAYHRRAPDRPGPGVLWLTTLGLLLLYLLTPKGIGGASHLDVRWLLPMFLLYFVSAPSGRPASGRLSAFLCAACIAHAGITLYFAHRIDAELDDFDTVLERLPTQARVLPLVGAPRRFGRVEPYLHYALWHTVDTGGRVGGLFSYLVEPPGGAPVVSVQFAHFREVDPPFAVYDPWRAAGAPRLPWAVVRRQYDYVLVAGQDPELSNLVSAGACPEIRAGAVTAYRIGASCPIAGGDPSDRVPEPTLR